MDTLPCLDRIYEPRNPTTIMIKALLGLLLTAVAAAHFTAMLDYTGWLAFPYSNLNPPAGYHGSSFNAELNRTTAVQCAVSVCLFVVSVSDSNRRHVHGYARSPALGFDPNLTIFPSSTVYNHCS